MERQVAEEKGRARRERESLAWHRARGFKGEEFEKPFDDADVAPARKAYDEGRRRGQRMRGRTKRKATRDKVRARAKTSKRYYRRATRDLRNPVARQLTSGIQVVVFALAIIGLYLMLQTADRVSGFIGGASKALQWLQDPNASIPHKAS